MVVPSHSNRLAVDVVHRKSAGNGRRNQRPSERRGCTRSEQALHCPYLMLYDNLLPYSFDFT